MVIELMKHPVPIAIYILQNVFNQFTTVGLFVIQLGPKDISSVVFKSWLVAQHSKP